MERRQQKGSRFPALISIIISPIFLVPIIMMLFGSLKTQGEALRFDLNLPSAFVYQNYIHVIQTGEILRGYKNSLIVTSFSVLFVIILGGTTGIIISRRRDKPVHIVYYYFLFGLTATIQMVTTYFMFIKIHLNETYIGVILVFAAANLPFAVLTFSSFVTGISREIDEAAVIDGCNAFQIIFGILFPIMKPALLTNLIITAISVWNNFQVPLYLMSSAKRTTIPMMIYNFYGLYARDWNYVFAALVITVFPILILYLGLQKYIVGGMTAGAVKG